MQQINNTWISTDGLSIIANGLPGASPAVPSEQLGKRCKDENIIFQIDTQICEYLCCLFSIGYRLQSCTCLLHT
jgi:hypothetical protein